MKRVAFFQRVFAHYQWGLVQELAEHSEHRYTFFGDDRDPAGTGIEPIPASQRQRVDYHTVRTWQPTPHLAFQPSVLRAALFGDYDCYILEGAFTYPLAWLAILAARLRRKRVLLYTHGWKRVDTNRAIHMLRLSFMRLSDGLLLYGNRAKSIGLASGIPAEKMYVAYNSMDYATMTSLRDKISTEDSSELREKLFGDKNLPTIIYTGRLVASKRVDFLLAACNLIRRQGQEVGLIIVGGGPEAPTLKDLAAQQALRVHFTGALYEEQELAPLFAAANVMVVPGPTGLSAVHAMTYGTPVVTSDVWGSHGPEIEGIVPGCTGNFYQTDDLHSLVQTVQPFVRDVYARNRYRHYCQTVVDRYYNPQVMRQVFDRAVSGFPAKADSSVAIE